VAALRIILIIHAIGVLAQAVFAGRFLSGLDASVRLHEVAGWALLALCVAQLAIGLSLRLPRGGALWFGLSSAAILLGEALQTGTGYGRFLEVHIPLGVIVAGGVSGQLVWLFRSPAHQ
jgi:hypothetical protein